MWRQREEAATQAPRATLQSAPQQQQRTLSTEHGGGISSITEELWRLRSEAKNLVVGKDDEHMPAQAELLHKSPEASRVTITYDFEGNEELRSSYLNRECWRVGAAARRRGGVAAWRLCCRGSGIMNSPAFPPSLPVLSCPDWGRIRSGLLFEDLDALAGNVAFLHADDDDVGTRAPLLVTASVDEIRLLAPIEPLAGSVDLDGRVVFVGRSSMLVRCTVSQGGKSKLTADFLYVARDKKTGKAHPVNTLAVSDDGEEKKAFDDAKQEVEAKKRARSACAETRLAKMEEEMDRAQELLERSQPLLRMPCLPPKAVLEGLAAGTGIGGGEIAVAMSPVPVPATALQNTMICQPQQRNVGVMGGRGGGGVEYCTVHRLSCLHTNGTHG